MVAQNKEVLDLPLFFESKLMIQPLLIVLQYCYMTTTCD